MNALTSFAIFLSALIGPSFAAVSLIKQDQSLQNLVVEEAGKGDVSQAAIEDFNNGRYLNAVLRAQPLADLGNPSASLILGAAYEAGKGVKQSYELALKNYRKAAAAGNENASYRLVRLLIFMGKPEHQKEARSMLEAIVEKGDEKLSGKAERLLGEGSLKGSFGGEGDFERARGWWEQSADKGNLAAVINLARLLGGDFGFPEKRDTSAALEQYIRASELGYGPAMTRAGSRLLNGDAADRNEEKAREWLAKAIKNQQWDAYLILGDYAENVTKDEGLAFIQYLKGAEAGHAPCMLKVASFYLEGRTGEKQDLEEALAWFQKAGAAGQVLGHVQAAKILLNGTGLHIVEGYNHLVVAAESGLVDMQNELGVLYLSGRLGVQDATAALSWFRRSAKGKFPAGAYNLASLLEQGIGAPQNIDQAGKLYTFATNAGHAQSATALGRFNAEGRGTERNLPRAWALFALAAERGDKNAEEYRKEVATHLNEVEVMEAREILAQFGGSMSTEKAEGKIEEK